MHSVMNWKNKKKLDYNAFCFFGSQKIMSSYRWQSLTLQISTCLSAGVDIIKTWKAVLPTHDKKKKSCVGTNDQKKVLLF